MLYGGIEAGGTKIICCVGDENGKIVDRARFDTSTPDVNVKQIVDYYKEKEIASLGLGWFGPLDLNPVSEKYGTVLQTPKKGWADYPILEVLKKELSMPMGIETDVNAALLGEVTWGSAKDARNVMYITVGTGVGAGIMVDGKILQGVSHPEAGHIVVNRVPGDDFECICPYHDCCLEGMAAGPAIEARWGKKGIELQDREEVWQLEAKYIAQALHDYFLILSPQKIILGGGVMEQKQLFPMIREELKTSLAGYVDLEMYGPLEEVIVPASLGGEQGLMGCIKIAQDA